MEDSGPYEIAEPRVITALETYTPSWLQTPRLKRLAEIVSEQAVMQSQIDADGMVANNTYEQHGDHDGLDHGGEYMEPNANGNGHPVEGYPVTMVHEQEVM